MNGSMRWDCVNKRWVLDPDIEAKILKLDLSKAELKKDIMFCRRCTEQYSCGEVGPTRCGICDGPMCYVRFHTQDELDDYRARQHGV